MFVFGSVWVWKKKWHFFLLGARCNYLFCSRHDEFFVFVFGSVWMGKKKWRFFSSYFVGRALHILNIFEEKKKQSVLWSNYNAPTLNFSWDRLVAFIIGSNCYYLKCLDYNVAAQLLYSTYYIRFEIQAMVRLTCGTCHICSSVRNEVRIRSLGDILKLIEL